MSSKVLSVQVVDTHVGGTPVRVVVEGAPDLGQRSLSQRAEQFAAEHAHFMKGVAGEPRGTEGMVGVLLLPPDQSAFAAAAIFFNHAGVLEMSVEGMMALLAVLARLGRISPGTHRIQVASGEVAAQLHDDGRVSVVNVNSFRKAKGVMVNVRGSGMVKGDVAWGGNWFFLVDEHGLDLSLPNVEELTAFAWKLRRAVNAQWHPEADHVVLFSPAKSRQAKARAFVFCPGGTFERSPSGAALSAKLACLAADGKLAEGEPWILEGIVESQFQGTFRTKGDEIVPTISGRPFVMAEAKLVFEDGDRLGR